MELVKFVVDVDLAKKTELEKAKIVAFYDCVNNNKSTFLLKDIISHLQDVGQPISNTSRLKKYLAKSKDFKKISENEYMITPASRQKLSANYGELIVNEDIIVSNSEVLDESLFMGKRGYLDKLVKQINHCYKNNCFDACAVCMRRVFEITLILAYENKGVQDQIKENGDYVMLEKIVADAAKNKSLHISRSRKEYDDIRELGNYAAHKIQYNTRKKDIDEIKQTYRVCLEELYYIAGLKA